MKDVLYKNNKIEVRKSNIHGYGVFAKESISVGELIEECYFIEINKANFVPELHNYIFKYNKLIKTGQIEESFAILLGFGMIYNCSETADKRNITHRQFQDDKIFSFMCIRDIKKDEEILSYYGDGWMKKRNLGI